MLGQITVAGVDVLLVAMRFADAAAQVVRHQSLGCPSEKSEAAHVRAQPISLFNNWAMTDVHKRL